jgi:hypothetical protein
MDGARHHQLDPDQPQTEAEEKALVNGVVGDRQCHRPAAARLVESGFSETTRTSIFCRPASITSATGSTTTSPTLAGQDRHDARHALLGRDQRHPGPAQPAPGPEMFWQMIRDQFDVL